MTADELWNEYINISGKSELKNVHHEDWCFGGAPDKLAGLVMQKIKYATASARDIYDIDDSEPLPESGDYSVILDSKDNALCIIQTKKTSVIPFNQLKAEDACKEGEGDLSLEYWRKVHIEFFTDVYKEYGLTFKEDINVLFEEFDLIYSLYDVKKEDESYCVYKMGTRTGSFTLQDNKDIKIDVTLNSCAGEDKRALMSCAVARATHDYYGKRFCVSLKEGDDDFNEIIRDFGFKSLSDCTDKSLMFL